MPESQFVEYRVVTEESVNAPWFGVSGGKLFRCWLCGHKFKVAEEYRMLICSVHDRIGKECNCIVCKECDGDDVRQRWAAHYQEAQEFLKKYFWLQECRGGD